MLGKSFPKRTFRKGTRKLNLSRYNLLAVVKAAIKMLPGIIQDCSDRAAGGAGIVPCESGAPRHNWCDALRDGNLS